MANIYRSRRNSFKRECHDLFDLVYLVGEAAHEIWSGATHIAKVDPSRPSPSQSLVSGLAVEESEFLESLWGTVDVLDQFLRVFAECSPKAGQGIPLGGHLALKTPVKQGVALGVPVEKFDELLREYGVGWYAKLAAEGCQGSLRCK